MLCEVRLIPEYIDDFDLHGFFIDGLFYIDKCLPIGCSINWKIWETFATFLRWLTSFKSRLSTLDHNLDDFIFVGEGDTGNCAKLMHCFKDLTAEIGIPLAADKTAAQLQS